MNMDTLIWTAIGVLIGANVGFIIAGLFGVNRDEEDPDD